MSQLRVDTTAGSRAPLTPAMHASGAATTSGSEHFLPIRQARLVELLCRDGELSTADAEAFRGFHRRLQNVLRDGLHRELVVLKNAYAPFDPDADTISTTSETEAERQQCLNLLFERFSWLLERSNFRRLTHDDIRESLAACSHWGLALDVDFDVFERLEVYARGDALKRSSHRSLRTWFRQEELELSLYQRLVVIFRLRDSRRFRGYVNPQEVYIKLFKDIPKADLEMLLPGTQVRMSLVDRAKIFVPTISGLSITIGKIIQAALSAAAFGLYGFLAFLGLVGGTLGYGARSVFGYMNTKQKYQLRLSESLYFQNLANNAGVLFRLIDEAEEQEARESLLAYFFLWRHAPSEGWTSAELDAAIEAYLQTVLGRGVDFEVSDGIEKLERYGVIERLSDDRVRARSIDVAIAALVRHRDTADNSL